MSLHSEMQIAAMVQRSPMHASSPGKAWRMRDSRGVLLFAEACGDEHEAQTFAAGWNSGMMRAGLLRLIIHAIETPDGTWIQAECLGVSRRYAS